jgi:CHAT domain-containing protein/tetratricopeptide (TPR) repeat protein
MKSNISIFITSISRFSAWPQHYYFILFIVFFLFTHNVHGQAASELSSLNQKALDFKYRVEYDSAIYYSEKIGEILARTGDEKAKILNEINKYDINILQRDFSHAQSGLEQASIEIATGYKGDVDLGADFYQVKGSYFLGTGKLDSAKYYLERSIKLRITKYGSSDTSLHYAYNKLGNLYLAESDFDSAYLCHQEALELSLRKKNPVNYLSASSYQNLGIAAQRKGDYNKAETCYIKSLQIKEALFNKDDAALAMIYLNLGKFYMDLSSYDSALYYYDKSEKILSLKYNRDNILFAHLYWNKGNVYTHKGDYVKATGYLSKAHSILELNLGSNNPDVSKVLTDLGFTYEKEGDTILAIECYNKAALNKTDAGIIKICRNLGNIYESHNEPDSADKYYNLSINFAKQFFSGISFDLALCYQYYGMFLAKSKKADESLWYYSQASDIFIKLFGRKNKDLSKVFLIQSKYFIAKSEYDPALVKIQEALIALLPGFSESDPYKNPSFKDIILDLYLHDILKLKAMTLYLKYLQSSNLKDLYFSLETIDLTIAFAEEKRKTYNEEESQLILNNLSREICDLGVTVACETYLKTKDIKFLDKAFQYSEKGKAIILLSAMRGLEAQTNKDIPKSTQDIEKNLSQDLATYTNMLYQERQKKTPHEAKLQLWSDKIFNIRLAHDSILASYKQLYPEYFRLKYDYSTISADSALMILPKDQAIVEYYLTDSLVVGFILSDNEISVEILGKKDILTGKLDSLRQNFIRTDYFNTGQKEFDELTSLSSNLYNILIRPFEDRIDGKRLIIIPDGELGYLSFDLLLKSKPKDNFQGFNNLTWLIISNPINYSSSATIFFEQTNQKSGNISGNLLAFAPSYDFTSKTRNSGSIDSVRLKLSPLKGTKEEINAISGIVRTKKIFDEKATETYFKKYAGSYGILHLAMHTIIDNQNPLYSKLVFTLPEKGSKDDGYLNTYELFGLHLPGQLAVLSACNTGSGKLERGEGIISLARGFFYAGIPTVVMTLWEIEDHSSANLVPLFYENLKKGLPNDIALQQAKVTYLRSCGKLESHPYFWAGYVTIGKINPISFMTLWKPYYYVLTGLPAILLIILIYFFINRRVFFHKKRY